MDPPSYRTVKRRLRLYAGAGQSCDGGRDAADAGPSEQTAPIDPAGGAWRARLARACADHVGLGPATLLLYDVTTLYFDADAGEGSASPGSPRNAGWSRRSRSVC